MKTFVRSFAVLLAILAICQASAWADDYYWVAEGNQSAGQNSGEKAVAPAPADCIACDPGCYDSVGCDCCGRCGCLGCDECPPYGVVGLFGFDSFKGISDAVMYSNYGAVMGLNAAVPVPGLRDRGFGWQLGMTYGVYDWDGGSYLQPTTSQQQIFVTTGFYRKAGIDQRLSFGIVYDWMINNNWGFIGTNPTIGQWRGQVEWAFGDGCNSIGVYGAIRDLYARETIIIQDVPVIVTTRAVSQYNLFWHHKFASGADSWVWIGGLQTDRLNGDGSLGDWVIGASIQAPLNDRLALYGNAQYMHPSGVAGEASAAEAGWNVGAGIVWYFGGHAVSKRINGKCWLPYLPVANNSTFLAEQDWVGVQEPEAPDVWLPIRL